MLRKMSLMLSDYWVSYLYFIYRHRYFPNFKKPRTFNEKLNYIKLFNSNSLRKKITDRLWVREYVLEKAPGLKFAKILWSGIELDKDVWDKLPDRFVIKANHGSQMTRVVNKKESSFEEISSLAKKWMGYNYAQYGREWFYYDQKRYLLIEEMLSFSGRVPPDYKLFCANGRVEMVQVDLERFAGRDRRRSLYSRDFERLDVRLDYPHIENLERPKYYAEAVEMAEKVSVDFDFIRVDLYLLDDGVYFGELTNNPGAGFQKFSKKSFDYYLGSKLPAFIDR